MISLAVSFLTEIASGFLHVIVGKGTPSATHCNKTRCPIQDLEVDVLTSFIVAASVYLKKIIIFLNIFFKTLLKG